MQLSRYAIGSAGEEAFGYCQAVRRGPHVAVSGSTGRDVDGRIVPGGASGNADLFSGSRSGQDAPT